MLCRVVFGTRLADLAALLVASSGPDKSSNHVVVRSCGARLTDGGHATSHASPHMSGRARPLRPSDSTTPEPFMIGPLLCTRGIRGFLNKRYQTGASNAAASLRGVFAGTQGTSRGPTLRGVLPFVRVSKYSTCVILGELSALPTYHHYITVY